MLTEAALRAKRKYIASHRDKVRAAAKAWFARNPEKRRIYARRRHLKAAYGLTEVQVTAMKQAQNDRCAICVRSRPLVIDHDHKTDAVRGLLCKPCNTALWTFQDHPILLQRAIDYLRNSNAPR